LRIGDTQKQGKLVPSRTFAFPQQEVGSDVVGRLEIFQRVGSVALKVGSESQANDLEVQCSIPGLDKLRFKLDVKRVVPETPDKTQEKRSRRGKKMDLAQQYLEQHNVEDVLTDAMRDLIREKPDNPTRYLSAQMLKLEPLAGAPVAPKFDETINPDKISRERLPPIDKQSLSNSIPPACEVDGFGKTAPAPPSLAPPAREAGSIEKIVEEGKNTVPGPAPLAIRAHDADGVGETAAGGKSIAPSVQEESRPLPAIAEESSTQQNSPAPWSATSFKALPSVGTWLQQPSLGADKVRIAIPSKAVPSVGTSLQQPPLGTDKAPSAAPFNALPSVGTWLQQPSLRTEKASPSVGTRLQQAALGASKVPIATPFKELPSVGTWLQQPSWRADEAPL
jgi:hypothetical protein